MDLAPPFVVTLASSTTPEMLPSEEPNATHGTWGKEGRKDGAGLSRADGDPPCPKRLELGHWPLA